MDSTVNVELLAMKDSVYSLFVFRNLITDDLIMCTKLPNWDMSPVEIGEKGFLKYKSVKAGEKYYNPHTQTEEIYRYTNIYITTYVKETDIIKDNTIINL